MNRSGVISCNKCHAAVMRNLSNPLSIVLKLRLSSCLRVAGAQHATGAARRYPPTLDLAVTQVSYLHIPVQGQDIMLPCFPTGPAWLMRVGMVTADLTYCLVTPYVIVVSSNKC